MANKPNTDSNGPNEAPKDDQAVAQAPTPEPVPAAPRPAVTRTVTGDRVTLVKGKHRVTTSHPVEINNYRARGYRIQK